MARPPHTDSQPSTFFDLAGGLRRRAARAGVAASFWTAVVLPVALVALLATGVERPADAGVLLALIGADAAALLLGRGYAREDPGAVD